ncbi:hypothetical protein FB45DRAFT_1055722 [Roridomyces roridus]|uniref:SH3 domain-containing protein n=1 Tax=Roridomyces roridus TaxID=1738132 RepID=A0AAD7C0T2_9AGAR|nr:hypothetical protein FB45DRAFT_1055722 [Roridomyces roridus]
MAPRLNFAPFRTHYFFLLTTVLAIVAWFIAFISQSVSTAQFGNKFVGVLWFAVFLQAFLTVGVILAIATDSVQTVRIQIAAFAVMATVFAVQGVQQGIFSNEPAVFMTGAGYLLLSMVDIFWVLYFTSEEGSWTMSLFNHLGTGGLAPPIPLHRMGTRTSNFSVEKKPRQSFALGTGVGSDDIYAPQEGGPGKRSSTSPSLSRRGTGLSRSNTGGARSIGSRKSVAGSVHSVNLDQEQGATATPDDVPPVPELPRPKSVTAPTRAPTPASPIALSSEPRSSRPQSMSPAPKGPRLPSPVVGSPESTTALVDHSAGIVDDENDDGQPIIRARALHAYRGSPDDPNELWFAKNEILEIEDQEGKWWRAIKQDGTQGIVPSNYLVLLPTL